MHKFCTLFLLLSLVTTMWGQTSAYKSDATFPFVVITKDTVTTPPTFTDEQFYEMSQGVIFQVNKAIIPDNDPFLRDYRQNVLPLVNSKHLQLRKVFIRGAASPEGPYANNERLGRARSQALLNELRRDLQNQYIETDADISCITEDYGYLCLLMKKASDPDYELVKNIYEECRGDEPCCKQRLQLAKKRTLWPRLLKEYFPRLRSARFILWFSEPDKEHAPQPKLLFGEIEHNQQLNILQPDIDASLRISAPAAPMRWTRRHLIAARTNLVHDFFYMPKFGWAFSPNIQFEYYPLRGHYTYNIGMTWGTNRKWDTQEFWQVRDFQAEVRRYFKGGGKFIGTYLGAFVHGDKYGIGLDAKDGWEGEGGGVGLSLGHTMKLNRKGSLRLEFMAAAGFFLTVFDPYVWGNPITGTIDGDYYYDYLGNASSFKRRNHRFTWLGPTNLGIQLTYDIIYRKKQPVRINN